MTNTYLREAVKYQVKLFLDQDDYYLSLKKLIEVSDKFIISSGLVVMDNGYYILEVVPKNENYAMRIFFDNNKKRLEYYFDICKNSGLDEKYKVPFYDDLYLDITYLNGKINILDENELMEAYESGDITDDDMDIIRATRDMLLKELKEQTNKYMNVDYSKFFDNF